MSPSKLAGDCDGAWVRAGITIRVEYDTKHSLTWPLHHCFTWTLWLFEYKRCGHGCRRWFCWSSHRCRERGCWTRREGRGGDPLKQHFFTSFILVMPLYHFTKVASLILNSTKFVSSSNLLELSSLPLTLLALASSAMSLTLFFCWHGALKHRIYHRAGCRWLLRSYSLMGK